MSRTLQAALIWLCIMAGCYFATSMVYDLLQIYKTIFPRHL